MRSGLRGALCLAIAVMLAGCGAGGETPATTSITGDSTVTSPPATTSTSSPPTTSSDSSAPETTSMTIDPGLEPLIEQAKADLAQRLGVAESEIDVASAELVTWPDASLGCPQPGMQYAQVLTDGSLIVLKHAGQTYPYHTGGSRYVPFLCENTK